MRRVEVPPEGLEPELRVRAERLEVLEGWLRTEIEDALSARIEQERVWREALKLYEGVPKNPFAAVVGIEGAPTVVVTLAAIATDSIYAQATDLVFSVDPIITIRHTRRGDPDDAKAMQEWANWVAANEAGLRPAWEDAGLDDVQLGTGVYYIPFVEAVKKTKVSRVAFRGPTIHALPVEDFLVPGGAKADLQTASWVAARFWLSSGELAERAARHGWDIRPVQQAGGVNWVRHRRESLGHTSNAGERLADIFEIWDIYAYFDIDDDGLDEDLYIVWDRTSGKVLKLTYNPYDHRPFAAMRYQRRAHLFYGMGVPEMIRPFQEEATHIHQNRVLNMILANARIWKAKTGAVPENLHLWPNRVIELDDPTSLQPEQMGDIYASSAQAEAITISLAERRVGVNEMSLPRPSQVLGSRTPGITALSLLQQVNRRFTPAFDGMRLGTAEAVRQCMYRYQERLLAGDTQAEDHIRDVLGVEAGDRVIRLLKSRDFDEAVMIEMTASSASVNRDADRQNAMLLVNILTQYYGGVLQMATIAANPQAPPQVRDVATRIAQAAGEVIERVIRTFDQVRDPETFIVQMEEAVDGLGGLAPEGLLGLAGMLGLPGGGGAAGVEAGAEIPAQ